MTDSQSHDYMETLRERARESKVYQKHQLVGLELAEILQDEEHKSLYIKLAKEREGEDLIGLAKRVVEMKQVKNYGAYFMSVLHKEKK